MVASLTVKVGPSSSRGRVWLEAARVFLAALIGGGLVRYPYWTCPLVHDDWVVQWVAGTWWSGRANWLETAFADYSNQVFLLWTPLFAGELRAFGLDPVPWRLTTHVVHSLSAALLYVHLSSYLDDRRGALAAALVWGLAAIGRWDNALLWSCAGVFPILVAEMLATMIWQRKLATTGKRQWGVLTASALVVMVLTWQIAALLILASVAQYWLLDRQVAGTEARRRYAWNLAPAVLLVASFPVVFPLMGKAPVNLGQGGGSLAMIAERAAAMMSVSLANLTFWSAGPLETQGLAWKATFAAIALAMIPLSTPAGRRLVLVFAVPALLLSVAAAAKSARTDLDGVLSAGRYHYFSTLFWCVVAGTVIDGLGRRWHRLHRAGMALAGSAVLVLFGLHQHAIAVDSARQSMGLWGDKVGEFADSVETLKRIAQEGSRERPVALADVPIAIPSVTMEFYPLSTLAAVSGIDREGRLAFRRIDELSEGDVVESRGRFRSAGGAGLEWSRTADSFRRDMEAVRWLDARAEAADRTISVPRIRLRYGNARPLLSDAVRNGLSLPPKHLVFPKGSRDGSEVEAMLGASQEGFSASWKSWLADATTESKASADKR